MKCPCSFSCAADLQSPAEHFLHRELHKEPPYYRSVNDDNLRWIPRGVRPRVASLMEEYHREITEAAAKHEQSR